MAEISDLLQSSFTSHQNGQLDEAEVGYKAVLARDPINSDALHLLGVVAYQRGEHRKAIDLIQSAISERSEDATFYFNLGEAFRAVGELERAASAYQEAIGRRKDYATALNSLGIVWRLQSEFSKSIDCFKQALSINSKFSEASNNLGNTFRAIHDYEAAISEYRQAIKVQPDFERAYLNLADTLQRSESLEVAITTYQHLLEIHPDSVEAWNGLGILMHSLGKTDESIECFRKAFGTNPNSAEVLNNLGNVLIDKAQDVLSDKETRNLLSEAVLILERCIELNRDLLPAYFNMIRAWIRRASTENAFRWTQEAQKVSPESAELRLRITTAWPTVFQSQQDIAENWKTTKKALQELQKTDSQFDLSSLGTSGCEIPFAIHVLNENLKDYKSSYAEFFSEKIDRTELKRKCQSHTHPSSIGFMVSRGHERAFLRCMGGVIENLNRELCSPVVLCERSGYQLMSSCLNATEVQVVPSQMVRMVSRVSEFNFDILYHWEIGTDSTNYFLPFFRPAPIQCTSWGVPATSGIPAISYYLSNRLVEPKNAEDHYSEQLELSDTFLTYQKRCDKPEKILKRQVLGFSETDNLYFCPQQLWKFHPDYDKYLAAILIKDLHGRVLLIGDCGGIHAEKIKNRFEQTISAVSDRIHFLPRMKYPEFLSLLEAVDVVLDTIYVGGGITNYDVFSLNRPIVTMPSMHARGRHAFACYHKMGIKDCIASNFQSYVNIAVDIGTDADLKSDIIQRISESSSILFEDPGSITEHERLFRVILNKLDE